MKSDTSPMEAGGEPISPKSMIVVTLDDMGIATANFISKEHGIREGFVQIELNGQLSVLPFRGKAKKGSQLHPEIGDKVLYYGPHPGIFELDVRVIETNATTRKVLAKVGTLINLLGSLPVIDGSGVAAPVAGLVGSFARLLRKQASDSHEAVYLGSVDRPVVNQEKLALTIVNKKGAVASLQCRVHDLGPQKGKAEPLSVRVANPQFEWTQPTISIRTRGRKPNPRTRADDTLTPGEYLQHLGFSEFSFEASSGRKTRSLSLPGAALFTALNWQELHCFKVSQPKSGAKRRAIPLQVDFALTRAELPIAELKDIGNDVAKLARAVDQPLPQEIETVRRRMPSVLSQIADLTPHALSLGAFDGIVVLLPANAPSLPSGNGILFAGEDGDGWRTTLTQPILLPSGNLIGHFSYELVFARERN